MSRKHLQSAHTFLQDLWLGALTGQWPRVEDESGDSRHILSHMGSALFTNVLRHLEARVLDEYLLGRPATAGNLSLVVVGSSAGGIGLLNHYHEVRVVFPQVS